MNSNIFEKILKNKHVLIIGIICLIGLTCISLACAADVDGDIAIDDASNVVEITNSTIDVPVANDTEPVAEPTAWDNEHIDPSKYNNPTIIYIHNNNDLRQAANTVFDAKNQNIDIILLVFDADKTFEIEPWFQYNLLHPTCKRLVIQGNGSHVAIKNPDASNEYHFLTVDKDISVDVKKLEISGFNTAIVNYGTLNVDQCFLHDNKVDYWFQKDYGGAIMNHGDALLLNSKFTDNYAKLGGAVYSTKDSYLTINTCDFDGNYAYSWLSDDDNVYTEEGCHHYTHDDRNAPQKHTEKAIIGPHHPVTPTPGPFPLM